MSVEQPELRHLSPDGRYYWDGVRWLPVRPAESGIPSDTVSTPGDTANLVMRGGRWFTRDQRLWWDDNKWVPYRRITWNSLHIHSNPPEDRATLSRNLGIWCALLGILGVFGLRLGAFSIMAAVAGPVAIYYALSFYRSDGRGGTRLEGGGKAIAGIVLSLVGLSGFLLGIIGWIAAH